MGIRKGLDRFFDKSELKILDDILPESQRHEVLDDEEALEGGIEVSQKLWKCCKHCWEMIVIFLWVMMKICQYAASRKQEVLFVKKFFLLRKRASK